MMSKGTLFCDGGARGNPGPAGSGAVLFDAQNRLIEEKGTFLGHATNNVAEYEGLLIGLDLAKIHAISDLHIRLDSELIVKQIKGEYKVKHPGLKPLWEKVKVKLTHFPKWEIQHVPRAQNKDADRMVNQMIDQHA